MTKKPTLRRESQAPTNEDAVGAFSFNITFLCYYRKATPSLKDKTKSCEGMLFLKQSHT